MATLLAGGPMAGGHEPSCSLAHSPSKCCLCAILDMAERLTDKVIPTISSHARMSFSVTGPGMRRTDSGAVSALTGRYSGWCWR